MGALSLESDLFKQTGVFIILEVENDQNHIYIPAAVEHNCINWKWGAIVRICSVLYDSHP